MRIKFLFALVALLAVSLAGGAWAPSLTKAQTGCCFPGAECCFPGSPCCEEAACCDGSCCPDGPCCPGPCCVTAKVKPCCEAAEPANACCAD